MLVGRPERGVVTRLGDGVGDHVGVEGPRPRVSLPGFDDHPHADAFDLGDRERLDFAAEDLHVDITRTQHVGLDLLAGACVTRDAPCQLEEVDVSHRRYHRP